MTIQIRPFQSSDREFIISLASRFFEFDLPEWRLKSEIDHANRAVLQKALEHPEPDSALLVAEDELGQPVGFIHLQTQTDYFTGEPHGYISDLAVAKSVEGQGIGRLLLEAAEAWSRTKGYRLLTLYVFAGNIRAQQLYQKYGFSQEVIKYVKTIRRNG